jgi:hypothetical protein
MSTAATQQSKTRNQAILSGIGVNFSISAGGAAGAANMRTSFSRRGPLKRERSWEAFRDFSGRKMPEAAVAVSALCL